MRMNAVLSTLGAAALALTIASGPAGAADLRINIPADPAMVDPITFSELIAGDVLQNVYEGFVGLDGEGNIIPALAESWEAHPDNLGFTFHLRQGVKFHSGRPFTAKDVKYTFEELMRPGNKAGLGADYLEAVVGVDAFKDGSATEISGIKVMDDHTVDVTFTKPDVLFPIYPFMFMDSGIVEELGPEWYLKASAGTGPFKFVAWNRGQDVKLAANADYWRGAPTIDGVDFLIVPSGDTAISMYEAGELDAVYADPATVRRILKDPQFEGQTLDSPAAQMQYLGMNGTVYPPFADKRVRHAVCIAIDRDAMVKGLYENAAYPGLGIIPPGVAGFDPNRAPIKYDPEAAKALMAEAGFPNGEGLPPVKITSTEPNKNDLAYYASQLNKVLGMPIEIEVVERGNFIKSMNAGEVAFFPWGWSADYKDALTFLNPMWHTGSKFNRPRWSNADYDALVDKALQTPDEKARVELYKQAEDVAREDWGPCPTTVRKQIVLKKPNVEGLTLTPFRLLPFNTVTIN
ncbi:MAG: ABC transporter substrate-binding protein [Rhodobiaceae bacterium]|nr:ABC transporter substrate-binding protein [Rhodobiaceae bacterium]